jgi:xanthine dehydrogenase accessory factor
MGIHEGCVFSVIRGSVFVGEFYRILERVENSQKRGVLATIIDVKGSSYRKRGTSMLMMSDGKAIGMLSGGCLENDLKARADQWFAFSAEEFEEQKSQTIVYDMRSVDENAWGRGSGCNGVMTVLVEPVTGLLRHQLIQIKHQIDRGIATIFLRFIDEDQCKKRAVVFEDGRVIGDQEDFQDFIKDTAFLDLPEKSRANVFSVVHSVPPRLLIFGAGDDAIPLSELAAKVGWTVVVADFRAALCNPQRFPRAETCRVSTPPDLLKGIANQDAVIIMTHDFRVDQLLLQGLLNKEVAYLGVLGPKERTRHLFNGKPIPEHIHSPVGLSIGAEGPEEIAISIMAEVIKERRFASEKMGVVHGC